jgi:hypothetical protein
MDGAFHDLDETSAVKMRRMRISLDIGALMMFQMMRNPREKRALHRHTAANTKRIGDGIVPDPK